MHETHRITTEAYVRQYPPTQIPSAVWLQRPASSSSWRHNIAFYARTASSADCYSQRRMHLGYNSTQTSMFSPWLHALASTARTLQAVVAQVSAALPSRDPVSWHANTIFSGGTSGTCATRVYEYNLLCPDGGFSGISTTAPSKFATRSAFYSHISLRKPLTRPPRGYGVLITGLRDTVSNAAVRSIAKTSSDGRLCLYAADIIPFIT